jgi:hypothetical protein
LKKSFEVSKDCEKENFIKQEIEKLKYENNAIRKAIIENNKKDIIPKFHVRKYFCYNL